MKSSGSKTLKRVIECILECTMKGIYIGLTAWLDVLFCIFMTTVLSVAVLFWQDVNPAVRDIKVACDFIVANQDTLYITILQLSVFSFLLYTSWRFFYKEEDLFGLRPGYAFLINTITGSVVLLILSFSYNKGETFVSDFLADGEFFKVIITYFGIYFLCTFIRMPYDSYVRNKNLKMVTVMDYIKSLSDDTLITFVDGDIREGAYTVKEVLTKGSSAFLQRILLPGCVTACLEDAIPYVAKDCHIYNSLQKDEAVIILVIDFTKKDVSLTAAGDSKTSLLDVPLIHKEHGSSISEEILKDLASKNGDIVISDNQDPDNSKEITDES